MTSWLLPIGGALALGLALTLVRRIMLRVYLLEARRLNVPERRRDMITTYPLA